MIYTLILAAGASSRLGGKPKALATLKGGKTFVQRIAETAREAGANGVSVVIGAPHGDQIKKALPPGIATAVNPRPERGMLSSIQAGLTTLPTGVTAVVVWPVDIPLPSVATVRAIFNVAPGKVVVPVHNKKGGHPVRLPRARFGEVAALAGDGSLKDYLDGLGASVERLPVDDKWILFDVDTPEDLAAAQKA